ncbi:TEK-like protein [Nodularia spumigena CS-591/12]|uniref:TEK-like protein n=1 Tax=Nodularia spumigena TaxID=70799 RepID=UPI00232DCB3F|nr:TEK-like protein [Nodularia spumigena]MDB9304702.1 TEK-like protein [Nodularia spumigena CS-591/12]MDB9322813.1 TEK-like protein [Nodularia spumigena CS-591/07A]MDB9329757.1 TEK-like protein [Nodularia spumigena CS-591/04]MDB9339155.1 TEK-like protein [Nodularia spumigena CS-589/07]MDB9362752.1 TEK-like protein [Nodularia spumigena CS-588/02]
MSVESNKTLKAAAISSLLAGGAVAASFISAEPAKAQFIGADSQSRVSTAVTSILSNGVTNNFAAEIVLPDKDFAFTGAVTLTLTYATVAAADASQVAITGATLSAANATYSASTVEAATARAVQAAIAATQNGDIIGIVKSWQSGGNAALD